MPGGSSAAAPGTPQQPLPRRRDLRPAAQRSAPASVDVLAQSRRPAAPPVSRGGKRRGFAAAMAVLIVPGLVATAGLPAYSSTSADPGAERPIARSLGQTLSVSADVVSADIDRSGVSATSPEELAQRAAAAA
ncbi:MAG: hypothetical protein JWP66_1928, partial [Naasia sp.]|nr:hypothetical protein [Naasia sp.]